MFEDARLSWRCVEQRSNRIAHLLHEWWGIQKGDRVGILLPNCLEWPLCYLGILKVGAIMVPLNVRYGDIELQEIARGVELRAVVARGRDARRLGYPPQSASDEDLLLICEGNGNAASAVPLERANILSPEWLAVPREPGDAAAICFTSGSSGLPKGAVYTHGSTYYASMGQVAALQLTSEDRGLVLAPMAFTGGFMSVYTLLYMVGACCYIEAGLDAGRALELLQREGITFMTGVPILYESMAARPEFAEADLTGFSHSFVGGAPVSQLLLEQYLHKGVTIRQVYGCTEAGGMISLPSRQLAAHAPGSCGWPLPSLELRLVNSEGRVCEVGEVGEIQVRGSQMMACYWNAA
ncbi:MAG: AMP-binding protein, partial [Parahaliea sp.]